MWQSCFKTVKFPMQHTHKKRGVNTWLCLKKNKKNAMKIALHGTAYCQQIKSKHNKRRLFS